MPHIVENPDASRWNDFIASQPESVVFHSHQWQQVLCKSFGYKPLYLASQEGEGFKSVLPMVGIRSRLTGSRLVSLPYSAQGGVLGDPAAVTGFIDYLKSEKALERFDYLQIRSAVRLPLEGTGHSLVTDFVDADLYLTEDEQTLWKKFPVSIRTSVRKAEKNGVRLHKGRGEAELNAFYRLNLLTRKGFGTPSFGKSYFRNILDSFPEATLYFAEWEGRFINTMLLIPWNGTYYYFYVGSDIRYRNKSGADFIVWELIKDAYRKGIRRINFGRMEKNNASLGFFKKKWGAVETQYFYYNIPETRSVSKRQGTGYRLVTGTFRRMPLWAASLAGPFLVKRLG